ncbi:c-type cytochrome [Pedobacter nutrimenti]|jgi:mono/diheme cytochrome c family protein|uniref:Cbb3-type cytochrome c oxidase subunit III n=1 Tax=Pedobacter nutrimenti TaxID=1241337 RepID=A0A318UID5_9SPHI|nr:cytochrome c [Pedobacter nutrimenti]PYF75873.1 cbb3-type cytochrome c oxidase subunit III [Pedobacter nutrimenti]
MKLFSTLLFMLMLSASATGQTNTNVLSGKALFENKCIRCHGKDGTKGMFGAKNLQESRLANDILLRIISDGKGIMPSWKKKLSAEQLLLLIDYIKTLRK